VTPSAAVGWRQRPHAITCVLFICAAAVVLAGALWTSVAHHSYGDFSIRTST
jgi:hypothetical protein